MATAATPIVDQGGPKGFRVFNDIDMAHVWGHISIPPSPATYTTGGLPIVWSSVQGFPGTFAPYMVSFASVSGNGAYIYMWNATSGNIQIFTASTAIELANASAIPAAVSGDTIRFEAIVQRS